MAQITGKVTTDYFAIFCEACGEQTENTYLGGDPTVPHFEATCKKCNTTDKWKLSLAHWSGLPYLKQE